MTIVRGLIGLLLGLCLFAAGIVVAKMGWFDWVIGWFQGLIK